MTERTPDESWAVAASWGIYSAAPFVQLAGLWVLGTAVALVAPVPLSLRLVVAIGGALVVHLILSLFVYSSLVPGAPLRWRSLEQDQNVAFAERCRSFGDGVGIAEWTFHASGDTLLALALMPDSEVDALVEVATTRQDQRLADATQIAFHGQLDDGRQLTSMCRNQPLLRPAETVWMFDMAREPRQMWTIHRERLLEAGSRPGDDGLRQMLDLEASKTRPVRGSYFEFLKRWSQSPFKQAGEFA